MYVKSAEYRKIGKKLINTLPEFDFIKDLDIRVDYLVSDKPKRTKSSSILGECIKMEELNRYYSGYDFVVVVYEPNILHFNQQQKELLVAHELMHIGVDESGKFYIKDHDIEEFSLIADNYGLDWYK